MIRVKKPKTLPPVRPNVGIEIAYRKRLDALIEEMNASLTYWLSAQYKANPPAMAQDASSAVDLAARMKGLRRQWLSRFDKLSKEMADHFAMSIADRSDAALKASLRKAGFTVQFQMTAAQRNVVGAAVAENVTLIKSIASTHLDQVEGLVMRGVSEGRDLAVIAKGLQERLGVTKRRAALIARDQTNKATATLVRNRQDELGLKAIWLHSGGGKHPRPSHVANSGEEYDPKTGWFDPVEKVWCWPGTLINCRCVSKTKVPGF